MWEHVCDSCLKRNILVINIFHVLASFKTDKVEVDRFSFILPPLKTTSLGNTSGAGLSPSEVRRSSKAAHCNEIDVQDKINTSEDAAELRRLILSNVPVS